MGLSQCQGIEKPCQAPSLVLKSLWFLGKCTELPSFLVVDSIVWWWWHLQGDQSRWLQPDKMAERSQRDVVTIQMIHPVIWFGSLPPLPFCCDNLLDSSPSPSSSSSIPFVRPRCGQSSQYFLTLSICHKATSRELAFLSSYQRHQRVQGQRRPSLDARTRYLKDMRYLFCYSLKSKDDS